MATERHVNHQNPQRARSGPNIGTTIIGTTSTIGHPRPSVLGGYFVVHRLPQHAIFTSVRNPPETLFKLSSSNSRVTPPDTKYAQIVTNIQTGTETVVKGISLRQPSIALGFIMISQLQFLGALSLVNYNTTQEPLLKDFVGRFR